MGEYRITPKAADGEPIAVSEGYESKRRALNGIESVRRNAPDAPVDEPTADSNASAARNPPTGENGLWFDDPDVDGITDTGGAVQLPALT